MNADKPHYHVCEACGEKWFHDPHELEHGYAFTKAHLCSNCGAGPYRHAIGGKLAEKEHEFFIGSPMLVKKARL